MKTTPQILQEVLAEQMPLANMAPHMVSDRTYLRMDEDNAFGSLCNIFGSNLARIIREEQKRGLNMDPPTLERIPELSIGGALVVWEEVNNRYEAQLTEPNASK